MDIINGCATALITPFLNQEVDYSALKRLIEFQIENNCAIVVCGTTAETPALTDQEYEQVIAFVVQEVAGRVPVIAGCGSNSTMATVKKAQYCQSTGVDGLLIVNPYYNKSTQQGIIAHFTLIAQPVNLPIILYNVPGRTGMNILPDTVFQLSQIPNIIGIKEASGDIAQVAHFLRLCGEDFAVYSGNDDMVVPLMSLGGKGVISVLSNVMPGETKNMVALFQQGKTKEAGKEQIRLLGLIKALFIETNPIPVKQAVAMLGLATGELRLPLVNMEPKNALILSSELQALGLI